MIFGTKNHSMRKKQHERIMTTGAEQSARNYKSGRMKRIGIYFPFLVLIVFACIKDDFENSIPEEQDPSDFLYETTHSTYMDLKFANYEGSSIPNVYFEVYSENPFTDGNNQFSTLVSSNKMLFKGNCNNQGDITLGINMPDYIDSIYICPRYIGLQQIYAFSMSSDDMELIIDPNPGPTKSADNSSTSQHNYYKSSNDEVYTFIGTYDNSGFPNYLEPEGDIISNELLLDINATLPESSPLPQSHPQYLEDELESNLIIEEDCEVWVTFVHEGAGWRNVLGYYIYDQQNPPASRFEINHKVIIFPNCSYAGSGGSLHSGDKVKLKYVDPETGDQTDVFPAGSAIGWFIVADGWRNFQVTDGNYLHYSQKEFNIETNPDLQKHNVLLYDSERDLILLGFEDIRRDGSSDQDFNDAVFYATSNPITAVQTGNLQVLDDPLDTDGDGVSNVFDEYPDDPLRAYNNYYPTQGDYGTFVFEDLWPFKGDYDFNDMVVDYKYNLVTNSDNEVVEIKPKFVLRAIGGSFRNGFGISLDEIAPAMISSITGQHIESNSYILNANGTEAGQSNAVVIVFDDAYDLLSIPSGGVYVNTRPDDPWVEPDTLSLTISLSNPMTFANLGLPPYNPFIVVNKNRSVEVHMPGSKPTDLVDYSLFGTGNDQSDPETGRYYFSAYDYPWAANIPLRFNYPVEKVSISNAHLMFDNWAESSGYNYMDWFMDAAGYRNTSNLYNENNK